MLSTGHSLALAAGFAPYLALGLYDAWLHGSARRVPLLERALHGLVGLSLAGLWLALLRGETRWAFAALAVFAVAGAWDELGFHGRLDPRERRLHWLAYGCFAVFLAVAWGIGALRWS